MDETKIISWLIVNAKSVWMPAFVILNWNLVNLNVALYYFFADCIFNKACFFFWARAAFSASSFSLRKQRAS